MGKLKLILSLVFSAGFIFAGVLLACFPIMLVNVFAEVLGILLIVLGGARFVFFLVSSDSSPTTTVKTLIVGIISLACGIFLLVYPFTIQDVVRITLAVWMFFTGGIQLISAYSYFQNHEKGRWLALAWGALVFGGSIVLFIVQDVWILVLSTVVAAYCILLGLAGFARTFFIVNGKNKKRKNIPLPFFLEASLPKATLKWIKSALEGKGSRPQDIYTSGDIPPDPDPCDIEVLIHLSDIGTNIFGHVDVIIGDQVFSYGNYDRDKRNIWLFGLFCDGVFAVCSRDKYIKFSLDTARKTLVDYRLKLEDEDKERIQRNVAEFLMNCAPWEPNVSSPYANALKRHGASIYKVTRGKYKTYFMLNTNCALLTDAFFEGTSVPRARAFGGIVTPGSLLTLYENELDREGSPVAERTLYVSKRLATVQHAVGNTAREELLEFKEYVEHEKSIRKLKRKK
ncbi:MAG: DUF308 domain-containing protein [Christensenella sp.]